ncbi:MAG: T9SS type A sorting domain-containing protein [Bacteroidia bacterium]
MDVKQTTDSGFIVVSIIYDTIVYKYNIYLIKTDTAGDTIWTKQYFSQYEQVIYSVQQTIDNGYIMTGYSNTAVGRSLYLIKTDYTGNTLWTRRYNPNINNYGYFVRQTKDGGFIICGATSTGSYIIKTDSLGMVGNGTGIAEVNNPFDFSVYPNPSSGNFTFEVKGIPRKNANLKIYNVLNQTVYTGTLSSYKKESVDLHHLPNGIYIATLYYGARTISEKVIIHK